MGTNDKETKPENIDEYKEWLMKVHNVSIDDAMVNQYNAVTLKIRNDVLKNEFWTTIIENLPSIEQEYQMKTSYNLFITMVPPTMLIKPFNSFLLKTYRKNIIQNENYPDPPKNGWILPDNWYLRINDTVRSSFVVKYLDGVEFLIEKLEEFSENRCIDKECEFEAKEEGYYAAHFYIVNKYEVPGEKWDTTKIDCKIEFQITTQLQEVIKRLLHKYYEANRGKIKKDDRKWQWRYRDDEFAANYLGHILHYVEGMIMDIREKK